MPSTEQIDAIARLGIGAIAVIVLAVLFFQALKILRKQTDNQSDLVKLIGRFDTAFDQINSNGTKRDSQMDQLLDLARHSQENEKALAIAINAVSQATNLDIQEKIALKEFWSGTLKELKAMREDYATDRNDRKDEIKAITEHTEKTFNEALQQSLAEHRATHTKIDKLPEELLKVVQPLVNEFKETLLQAERRFYVAMESAIRKALEDENGPDTKPLDPLSKSPLSLGHTPPSGTQIPGPFNPPLLDTTGNVIGSVGGATV